VSLLTLVLVVSGCQIWPDKGLSVPASQVISHGFGGTPRPRRGSYAASVLGMSFLGPKLGAHGYYYRLSEKDGIVYTCRAGHIDIAHLRIAADWTAYLVAETYRHLMANDPNFSYKLLADRSRHYVQFHCPSDWSSLPEAERRAIAEEIAWSAGPYLAYTLVTWHEILTWFGFKCVGLPTEYSSAFSWEDSFSNLLGTVVAVKALHDPEHSFNQAMTIALDQELAQLGIQPARVAKRAADSVKGTWYTGDVTILVTMRKRNYDIGLQDGLVTPSLIPSVPGCSGDAPPSYPVPHLDALTRHGFSLTLEIEPHEWESDKILHIVYGDKPQKRLRPREHVPIILHSIRQEATRLYPEFDYTAWEDGVPPYGETPNVPAASPHPTN
jgi:hypothetical protein